MKYDHHHLSVGLEALDNGAFLLKLDVSGKLSHEDYEVFIPMFESAVAAVKEPRIRIFLDATDLDGVEPRAIWDDLRLGIKHGSEFEKIAIFGDNKWLEFLTRIGKRFTSGEVRYFENRREALEWVYQ